MCIAKNDGVPTAAAGSALSAAATQPRLFDGPAGCQGPAVDDIDWSEAERTGMGGYAAVCEVEPGCVTKVGDIQPREAALQG